MKVGDSVQFGKGRGIQRLGKVAKINSKSVKVIQTQPCKTYPAGTEWRVSPSLCRAVNGPERPYFANSAPTPAPRFAKGEQVYFMHRGEAIQGFVKQVNTRTVSIETTKGSGNWWRVPHAAVRRGEYNV